MCSNVTQIDVIDNGNMNVDLFVEKYAYSGKPLLVKNATNNWEAMVGNIWFSGPLAPSKWKNLAFLSFKEIGLFFKFWVTKFTIMFYLT